MPGARLDRLTRWSTLAGGVLSLLVALLVLANPDYYLFSSPPDFLVPFAEGAALLWIGVHLGGKWLDARGPEMLQEVAGYR